MRIQSSRVMWSLKIVYLQCANWRANEMRTYDQSIHPKSYIAFSVYYSETVDNKEIGFKGTLIWEDTLSTAWQAHHFFRTILSGLVPVCAATNFFRSPIVSSGLGMNQGGKHNQHTNTHEYGMYTTHRHPGQVLPLVSTSTPPLSLCTRAYAHLSCIYKF